MVTLLLVAIVLVIVVGYMVIKVTNYRKAQRDFEVLETASMHGNN
jgi:heme/copper-type cytochrome/quinol oxidase subunit 2